MPNLLPYLVSYNGICHLEDKKMHRNLKRNCCSTYDLLCGKTINLSPPQSFTLQLLKHFAPALRSLLRKSFGVFTLKLHVHLQNKQCPATGITKLFRQPWVCFDPLKLSIFLWTCTIKTHVK